MGLRVNNNIAAFNAYRNLQATDKQLSGSLEKLSSGFRINKAADDAAGLVVSEGLRAQIGGLTVAARNAQDGVNLVQTADGALGTVSSILQRMTALATQAANEGTQTTESIAAAAAEYTALIAELGDITGRTSFNGTKLLDAAFEKTFQIGSESDEQLTVTIGDVTAGTLGVSDADLADSASAQAALEVLKTAINTVSSERAKLGAVQNRFEYKISSINIAIENLTASESAIRDTDMAAEMTKFTKNQILSQAGTSMLAQANSASQNVLTLLRG